MHRSVLCVGEDLGIGADVRTFLLPSSNMDRDLLEVWPHRPPQGVGGVVPVVASCEQAWTRSTENESGYRVVLVNQGLGTEEWSFRLQLTTNKNICYAPITPTVLIYLLIGSLALS